ncbi:MAG: C25 family cysteine peptidase [candidate division WOR-3 bacterium]
MKKLIVLLLPVVIFAGTITKTIIFNPDEILVTEANGFDVIQMGDFASIAEPGKPSLPLASVNFVVPANATVTGVEVKVDIAEELPGIYRVHPAQKPVPLSVKSLPPFVAPDPLVYSSNMPYPSQVYEWQGYTGTMSGWRVCGMGIYPLTYLPASGSLTINRKVTVKLTYEEGAVNPPVLTKRQKAAFAPAVASVVVNPEDVKRFAPPERDFVTGDCDYCIITNSSLASNFSPLAEWRTKKGLYTRIFKTDSIQSAYTGRDLQEKIRNFIIDYWTNHGLIYVLLAGDNSIVPARRGRVVAGGETGNIPADLYYADLQWSWDGDHDNLFGEMSGDTVDLFYDLFVGRASVDNVDQVNTFIAKTLYYEKTPTTDYLKKMLLPYVLLWTGYSGKIVSDTIAAKTPSDWTDSYIHNPSTTTPMRDSINNGYHFCHVAAHGDDYGLYTYYGDAIYTTNTALQQTNSTRLVIMNSIACIAGNFEASDCLAEELMNNPNGGAVAVIMNSRYGWGSPPSMGASEKLSCIFYTYYFLGDTAEIGRNHCSSKGIYSYYAQYDAIWRWCYYALNLFGDPALPLWNGVPGTMAVEKPDTTTTGPHSIQVKVTSDGSPVSNALICCYKPGEVHQTAWTDASGFAQIPCNPLTPGTMFLTVTSKHFLPVEETIAVVTGTPLALDHDTGYCKLSVTTLGSIGFTQLPPSSFGAGFSYPKTGNNSLYYASFILGNSESYVVDRFYGQPSLGINADFAIVDTIYQVLPPFKGDEHYRAVLSDAGHATPKNIKITQNSYMNSATGYDDFVVIVYTIKNEGASPVNGLYAGIFADFNIHGQPNQNTVTANEAKRLIYMRHSATANPSVGVKILFPKSFANLCAIDHARYVEPDSAMSEGMKFRVLNGTINQRNSNRAYNWSVGASVGPFDLNPDGSYQVAFAFVGGTNETNLQVNADSAQSWFDNYVGIEDKEVFQPEGLRLRVKTQPNPFSRSVHISYHTSQAGPVRVDVFDITGRLITNILNKWHKPGNFELNWDARKLAMGVYILQVTAPNGTETSKLVIER